MTGTCEASVPLGGESPGGGAKAARADRRVVKCVVWDLDDTLWEGTLLEDTEVRPRPKVLEIIRELDGRGILQSVASKNDYGVTMEKLRQLGVDEYFLHPQINWNSKASSVAKIAEALNIGLDAVAFIDDQPFEREEVAYSLPQVMCLDAAGLDRVLDLPEMNPPFVTDDSKMRRQMYRSDIERNRAGEEFVGPKEEFLAGLGMVMTVAPAGEEDLRRAEELTVRTNQLNTTGRTYSYEELDGFRRSPGHRLLVAGLRDKFGSYGKIGLALVECGAEAWTIRLLLMSCRVISRGVGGVLLNLIMREARAAGVALRADFVPNERNRAMYVTYKFAGFRETGRPGEAGPMENDLSRIPPLPDYVEIDFAF